MKQAIMRSANFNSKSEGRSLALRKSHKAANGTLVASGKVVHTLKQQNRLHSNYTALDEVKSEVINEIDIDFMGMM